MKLTDLYCEYVKNPMGLDETQPKFSWEIRDEERGQRQSAYQILVAGSEEILRKDEGDIWDSGRVASEQSVNVLYQGAPLESGKEYYWKVRIWDKNGNVSKYSEMAHFEMGLLNPGDWQGCWITQGDNKGPLFRKEFEVDKDVKRARVYISGLGYYELRLNGEKVGEEVLDPGQTDYEQRILYTTQDITRLLRKGKNAVGVMLGNGRYSPPAEVLEKNPNSLKKYGESPVLLLQMNIEFCEGSGMSLFTDETWRVSYGPIQFNDIYDGEIYDARRERDGWDLPDYDDSGWEFARKASPALKGRLVSSATFPPIKVCKTLYPRKLTSPHPGLYIYDFGQNFTGWVRLRGTGKRGDEVKIRYAELLDEEGMLNTVPNRGAKATDVYIFKGEGEEVYEPRFTYHGFRYVEVSGFPGIPSLESVEGRVVHTAVPSGGSFFSANPLLNQIHNNVLWGQVSNLMSVPTDCPQRDERMGWLGDAQLVVEEALYNFKMGGFYRKWLADLRAAQKEDGSLPDVVPPYWPLYPADPAWGTACVTIPWSIYLYYGDKRILEENYSMMKRWVAYLETTAEHNIIAGGKYGDWCPPWHVNSVDTPISLVSTWYYYHDTVTVAKAAKILGYEDEAAAFGEKAGKILEAFNENFLAGGAYTGKQEKWYEKMAPPDLPAAERQRKIERLRNTFAVESQTANCLPLYLNMAPKEKREAVLKSLLHDIAVVHNNHLNTGIVGTRYLLDVLTDNGEADLAFKVVTQTTYPGWGYMIKEGATTLWERWEYLADEGMNSHNHIMLGTVDAWFYRALAGISLDEAVPGFKRIIIKPHPVTGLESAGATLKTIRGIVSSSWFKEGRSLTLKITIPVNSTAIVYIPKISLEDVLVREGEEVIWRRGKPGAAVSGISGGGEEKDYVVFTVGSGLYTFTVSADKSE